MMHFDLVLVGFALLVSVLRVCICSGISAYNLCSRRFECGDDAYSYPFWGGGRPYYCGVSWFALDCRYSHIDIVIRSQTYRVLNISEANQIMTIVRQDVLNLGDSYLRCPSVFRNDTTIADSGFYSSLFEYGPGTKNATLFYGCPFKVSEHSGGSFCRDPINGTNINLYLKFESGSVELNQNTSECRGSILIPVRASSVHRSSYDIFKEGFEVKYDASNYSDCDHCTKSDGSCGTTKFDNSFHCYCRDGSSQRMACPPSGTSSTNFGDSTNIRNSTNSGNSTNSVRRTAVVVGSVSGFCVILVIILLWICLRRKFSSINLFLFWKRSKNAERVEEFLRNNGSVAPKRYNYSDIKRMTDSFKDKLGQGGFGGVFKGKLMDGRLVAVKVMKESKGDGEDFINEVASISRTSHVNVVSLLGFCFDGSKRALIYEFMPNGSLEKFIYTYKPLESSSSLPWEKLYAIVVGVSRGLEYLHRGCNTRILHFDIKPHNILLDEDFCPKISDFGLAKLCSAKESHVSMLDSRGTAGYIAPEVLYRNFGGVSHKSDVYSYGMMVLEIVGGRKNIDGLADHTSEIFFPHWIHTRIELNEDLGLHGITSETDAEITKKMILVGLWCIQTNPSDRPSMSKVVEMLEGSLESLRIPPKVISSSSPGSQHDSSTT
ncbi:hypothetical protein GIB67_018105 [Kingdonia uniflora]|uniref:Protein kinase domain-containing protein n=1 Tax=Kingdonia uniflora TaxID=39325 RepID=A0A7J7NWJ6_9MAGN|nr:hypothetical protein GIB67_018105 [Kingdonia uniflora]